VGRPIHTKFGGNVSGTGDQIRVMAHLDATVGPEPAWIVKQTGSTRFNVSSVAGGATPTRSGTCFLVGNDEPVLNQCYLRVLPTAVDDGGGALFSAAFAAATATVTAGGSGYSVDDTLTLAGGTSTQAAIFDISTVSTIAAQDETDFDNAGSNGTFTGGDGAGGTAYVVSDTITMSDGTVITVNAIDGNGDVTEFTITTASTSGTASDGATLTQASTSGTGADFDLTLGDANQAVFAVAVTATDGEYSVLPTAPAATTTSGSGTGATLTTSWGLGTVSVVQGGDDWTGAPALQIIGNGSSAAATAVLTGNAITSVTTNTKGSGYTSLRVATDVAGRKFATKIHSNIVKTSDGTVYNVPTDAVFDQN
jgi:hypothetical protein